MKWRRIVAARGNTVKYWFIEIYWFLIRGRVRRPYVIFSEHRLKHFYHTVTMISPQGNNTKGYARGWGLQKSLPLHFSGCFEAEGEFFSRHDTISAVFGTPCQHNFSSLSRYAGVNRPSAGANSDGKGRSPPSVTERSCGVTERRARRGKYLGGAQATTPTRYGRTPRTKHSPPSTPQPQITNIILIINQSIPQLPIYFTVLPKLTLSNFTKVANNTKTLAHPGDFPLPAWHALRKRAKDSETKTKNLNEKPIFFL